MSQKTMEFPSRLTEKYRPRKIQDFVGIAKPKVVLEAFLKRPTEDAYLFLGPSGLGKTSVAMALSEQLKAELHHIPSQSCDMDTVDRVTRMCWSSAFNFQTGDACDWHCVIVDEADRMTPAAQTLLLSKLDATAPPPRTIFLFTANSKQTLEPRFLSRCKVLEFSADSMEEELPSYLARIYRKEGGKHPLDFEAIAKSALWNVRDALNKIEVELLIGARHKELPQETLKIVAAHTHDCKKCGKGYKHLDPKCELPFRTVCPECGGATSVGQERAAKAWKTIRKKIADEINSKKKSA